MNDTEPIPAIWDETPIKDAIVKSHGRFKLPNNKLEVAFWNGAKSWLYDDAKFLYNHAAYKTEEKRGFDIAKELYEDCENKFCDPHSWHNHL